MKTGIDNYPLETQVWEVKTIKGYGGALSIVREGGIYPVLNTVRRKEYYTDYPERIDEYGEKWSICSDKAALEAGNYVATPEIKAAILEEEEANARLAAAAPELLKALYALAERYEQQLGDGYLGGIPELDAAQAAIRKATAQ